MPARKSLGPSGLHVAATNLRQGSKTVVMVSEDEWSGLQETLHLLGNPANAAALLRSIADLNAGRGVEFDP
jgi:antitoxin YefM